MGCSDFVDNARLLAVTMSVVIPDCRIIIFEINFYTNKNVRKSLTLQL